MSIELSIASETPNTPYFVDARNDIPLRSDLKPSIKLLSRKPAPTVVSRKDPVSGIEKLTLEADDDDDEDEEGKVQPLSAEERLLKAQREREEKQRKYEEARERLFGSPSPASGVSSPRNGTSPPSRSGERGRGRSRGHVSKESSRDMRDIGEDQSGPSTSGKTRQLYDPNYNAKPDSMSVQRKEQQSMDSGSSTPVEEAAIRSSRGPDGNGRGGIGFTRRGGKGI